VCVGGGGGGGGRQRMDERRMVQRETAVEWKQEDGEGTNEEGGNEET